MEAAPQPKRRKTREERDEKKKRQEEEIREAQRLAEVSGIRFADDHLTGW